MKFFYIRVDLKYVATIAIIGLIVFSPFLLKNSPNYWFQHLGAGILINNILLKRHGLKEER